MNVGVKIGLAATAGIATGAGIGALAAAPSVPGGSVLGGAGVGTMGLFGTIVVRNPPFSDPAMGLVGVAMGGLWAGFGAAELAKGIDS